jgi:DNA-binding transcriptional MocR family regulator
MTIWLPILEGRKGPRYLGIADALKEDVEAGRLKVGTRLPTHRELAYRLGVTVGTVSRAYLEAERRGLVRGEVGRGTFVRARDGDGIFAFPQSEPAVIDFSLNRPSTAGIGADLAATLADLSRQNDLSALISYQNEFGFAAHREAAAAWLTRTRIAAPPARIAITCGGQHGLYAALAAATRPGDVLLVEALTFPAIKAVAGHLGLRLHGVAMDREGLLPDALETACRELRPRALFTMPTLHNPTSTTLPLERRRAIAEIARRHDLLIVEDDIYGFLVEDAPEPIANLAPERVFHVTSLSKSMSAGLRIGYVVGPEPLIARLGAAVRHSVWMTPPLMAEIAARWIRDGTGDRLAEARRQEAHQRQALALKAFAGHALDTHPASYHLWLHLPEPWRWSDFVAAAEVRAVRVTPPDLFVAGRATAPHAVRICLCAVESDARLEQGLARLADLLAATPEPRLAVV